MSDILITKENLFKFSKRLQKALSEYFNQKISLNDASTLFSKSMGTKNVYHLQQILNENLNKEKINNFKQKFDKEYQNLDFSD
jgi:hypothetical protein